MKNKPAWFSGTCDISHTLGFELQQNLQVIVLSFSKQIRQLAKIAEQEGTVCYFRDEVHKSVMNFIFTTNGLL